MKKTINVFHYHPICTRTRTNRVRAKIKKVLPPQPRHITSEV